MQDFDIVAPEDTPLALACVNLMHKKFYRAKITHFADTESLLTGLQKKQLKKKNILLIFQLPSQQHDVGTMTNNHLFNLLLLISALRVCEVKKIALFLPYLPYARQEKIIDDQVEPMFSLMSNLLRLVSLDALIASDVHTSYLSKLSQLRLFVLNFESFWASVIKDKIIARHASEGFCIVSPDEGGKDRVQKIAELLQLPVASILKIRTGVDETEAYAVEGDADGKIAIIVDDILDTGKTATNAAELLRQQGATRIFGCFTHAVLSPGSCERLIASCIEKIYLTDTLLLDADTLPGPFCVLSSQQHLIALLKNIVDQVLIETN